MFTARLLSRIGDHLAKVAIAIPSAVAFVAAVPAPLRARAFGVAQSGLAIIQRVAPIVIGLAAEHVAALQVVAASGALGTIGVCVVAAARFRDQLQSPRLGNATVPAEGVADPHDPDGPGSVRAGR